MGDLIQALPAISDLACQFPEAKIDWVVDKNFSEIPSWHPAVANTLITNHREWSKRPFAPATWREIRALIGRLRAISYDQVLDLQTNYKSALITRIARGRRCGPARGCTAEPLVHLFYQQTTQVARQQPAINRLRELSSRLLNYSYKDAGMDFPLAHKAWPASSHMPDAPYLVFVTNASWPNKRLPLATWVALADYAAAAGYRVLLPWGNRVEQQLASRLAAKVDNAQVLPGLNLSEIASLLFHSDGAICNDTGLAHLAAALGRPTVTAYGPTDPGLIAATGPHASQVQATNWQCLACYKRSCAKNPADREWAVCLERIAAPQLWSTLQEQIKAAAQLLR